MMKHKASLLLFAGAVSLGASGIEIPLQFHPADLSFSKLGKYDLVEMREATTTREVGAPQLPVRLIQICLPPGAYITQLEVQARAESLPGHFLVHPVQPPHPISKPGGRLMEPNPEIYRSARSYPSVWAEPLEDGNLGGYRLATIAVYPLRYIPQTGELKFARSLRLQLHYESGSPPISSPRPSRAEEIYRRMIKSLVVNPQDVDRFTPISSFSADTIYDHLIVTPEEFRETFEPLVQWHTRRGWRDTLVALEDIYSQFAGRDSAEKLREFIKYAYENRGTSWVLLGGDAEMVPVRRIKVQAGGETGYLPCDLYYSDLDGDWDANGNGVYGESSDSVDIYPDVFVGRAAVNDTTEAANFVRKALRYEKDPELEGYPTRALFAGFDLDNITRSEYLKEAIDNQLMPDQFEVDKVYDSHPGSHKSEVIAALNEGKNLVNHSDHSSWNFMGTGSFRHGSGLYPSDVNNLNNGVKQVILYSLGCYAAAFDYSDCIAEYFTLGIDTIGGAVSFIGNSRYGWYQPGNLNSLSAALDKEFFKSLFERNCYFIGQGLADSKIPWVGMAHSNKYYRWVVFELNLLGEPAMPIWTDEPETLMVVHPESLLLGEQTLELAVYTNETPLEGALVCLWKGAEVYETAETDLPGQTNLVITPLTPGMMQITVTAQNCLPYQDSIEVIEPQIVYYAHQLDDSTSGNSNNQLEPGEVVDLFVVLQNISTLTVENVQGTLQTGDGYVELMDSLSIYGGINPQDTAWGQPYRFSLDPASPPDRDILFLVEVVANGIYNRTCSLWVNVAPSIQEFSDTRSFKLFPVQPSPGIGGVKISYQLACNAYTTLKIYDVTGRIVKDLAEALNLMPGAHSVSWDGRDEMGREVPSGIYLILFEVPAYKYKAIKKFILLKK